MLIVGLVLVGAWFLWGGPAPGRDDAGASAAGGRASVGAVAEREGRREDTEARAAKRQADRRERDALRRKIVEALERRDEGAAGVRGASDEEADGGRARTRRGGGAGEAEAGPTPGALVDRSGNHAYLLKTMNEELMPLVEECYALARAANPAVKAELSLNVELLGDPELGGVVDSVEPDARGGPYDAGLVECARESIQAVTLPPPPEGGRDAFVLSMRLDDEARPAEDGGKDR